MNENDEKINADEWLKDLPAPTENIAFAPEEMLLCAACGRANAPTRPQCFYCAAELPVSEKYKDAQNSLKSNFRRLENWEKGFNLILTGANLTNIDYKAAGELINLETETAEKIIASGKSLPLLRAETKREAEIVQEKIAASGVETKLVSDESLQTETAPRRLRGLEFVENKLVLTLFNADEVAEIAGEDLILIVSGAIFERKTEAIEKRKKGDLKILEASETASDEILLDIYSRNDEIGYRILTKGFDFSGLGAEKGILARENLKKLADKLREFAPGAKISDDYLQIREILGIVWEIENRRDAKGLKRHSFSQFDFANIETSSNLQQFTKYSRLQRQLI